VTEGLDRAAALAPRSGSLDLYAFAERDRLGGALDYAHHIRPGMSAFAHGWIGAARDSSGWRTDGGVLAGLRMRW
jgi:hypothetical protein